MSTDSNVPRPPDRRAASAPPRSEEARAARVLELRPEPSTDVQEGGAASPAPNGRSSNGARPSTAASNGASARDDRETDATRSTERLARRDGRVVAFPRQPKTHRRKRIEPAASAREPSGRQAEPVARVGDAREVVERPKYLASELLKQEWFPRAPLARSLRFGALGGGAAGAIGVLAIGGMSGGALVLAGLLAACALLGVVSLTPQARGAALAGLALTGATVAGWMRLSESEPAAPLLLACIMLVSSALFFRAAHRTSRLARALVVVGLASTAAWLALTGGVDALVIESLEWQAWIVPTQRLLLGLVVVSTLLTFLDPTGHGGAWVAGIAFLVWLGLDAAGAVALAAWPQRPGGDLDVADAGFLAALAYPLLAALGAGGLCQVWVLLSRPPKGKRETPLRGTMG